MLRGLRLVLLILACLPCASAAAPAALAPARDLAADAREMRAGKAVMLVLFSQADCRWCERVKAEFLLPLQKEHPARQRILLREIALDADTGLRDFDGRATTQRRFAAAAGARFSPTLAVYGPDGRQLVEPIVGFRLADFYAEYVNRAVEDGLARLGAPSRRD